MTLPIAGALLASAAAVVLADQASKALAERRLADGCIHPVGSRVGFRRVLNSRSSLVAMPLGWAIVVWIAALAGAAVVVAQGSPSLGTDGAFGLGLALGGATSNLADRVLRDAVVDFIALRAWPTFNLADAAMVAGTVVLTASLS